MTTPSGRCAISLSKVRDALIVMVGFLVLLWVIQAANWADGYRLDGPLAIQPHSLSHLSGILTAPFLHVSWQHIEGNSVPLFVLGFLSAYRGITKFVAVTAIVIVISGLSVWLFQSGGSLTVGASGLVFGYFGYVLTRGFFDRNWLDVVVGVVAGAMYYYILSVAIPGTPGVSWLDHSGGLFGGVLAGWLLRARPGTAWRWRPGTAWRAWPGTAWRWRPGTAQRAWPGTAQRWPIESTHDSAYRRIPLEGRGHGGSEAARLD